MPSFVTSTWVDIGERVSGAVRVTASYRVGLLDCYWQEWQCCYHTPNENISRFEEWVASRCTVLMLSGWLVATSQSPRNLVHAHIAFLELFTSRSVDSTFPSPPSSLKKSRNISARPHSVTSRRRHLFTYPSTCTAGIRCDRAPPCWQ